MSNKLAGVDQQREKWRDSLVKDLAKQSNSQAKSGNKQNAPKEDFTLKSKLTTNKNSQAITADYGSKVQDPRPYFYEYEKKVSKDKIEKVKAN